MNRVFLALAAILALAVPAYAEVPIRLNLGSIEVEDRSPPIPNTHGPSPAEALEHWAHERLAATGNGPPAHFIILDAAVISEKLPVEHGFSAMFKDQQNRKVTAHLKARLEYASPQRSASATAEAEASTTIPESAMPADVDAAYAKVIDLATHEFDSRMTTEIRSRLGELVAP